MKEEYILQSVYKKDIQTKEFIEQKFHKYVRDVLLWEFLLVLGLMLILYKIIDKMLRQERDYRDFLELIILTISHKFGNFLAAQKGNIEILKGGYDPGAIRRLELSQTYMQEDFHKILEIINSFKEMKTEKEKLNIKEIVERTLSVFETSSKLTVNMKDVSINANRQIVENIIYNLLENAVRYSKERIHIRLSKRYLAIRNDISQKEKGSGVGLKIAEALAKKEGFTIQYHTKGESFIVFLKFT
jgi:signal transduction histidine kinase